MLEGMCNSYRADITVRVIIATATAGAEFVDWIDHTKINNSYCNENFPRR